MFLLLFKPKYCFEQKDYKEWDILRNLKYGNKSIPYMRRKSVNDVFEDYILEKQQKQEMEFIKLLKDRNAEVAKIKEKI